MLQRVGCEMKGVIACRMSEKAVIVCRMSKTVLQRIRCAIWVLNFSTGQVRTKDPGIHRAQMMPATKYSIPSVTR